MEKKGGVGGRGVGEVGQAKPVGEAVQSEEPTLIFGQLQGFLNVGGVVSTSGYDSNAKICEQSKEGRGKWEWRDWSNLKAALQLS